MMYKDNGHYYVDGALIDNLTVSKCRDLGGIPSVTTKLEYYSPPGLKFWAIEENLIAAYEILNGNEMTIDEFIDRTREEFYRTHNHLVIGTLVHDILDKLIKNAVKMKEFNLFYRTYADTKIIELADSVYEAYQWFNDVSSGGVSEKIVYDKEKRIAGTADFSGIIKFNGKRIRGGIDWKTKYVKRHPGFRKDGRKKSLGIKKDVKHQMQLGAYGAVEVWEAAYIVNISTNPDVPGIMVHEYSANDLVKGYKMFTGIAKTFDIAHGYIK